MGRRSNNASGTVSAVQQTPTPQPPATEYFYDDGFLRGSRTYQTNNGTPIFYNQSFSTPDEQAIESQANGYARNLLNQAAQAFQLNPQQIDSYRQAYLAPQQAALNESYNQARGAAINASNAAGTMGSVGFNHYLANELERNRAQGMADLEGNAQMMQYELPRRQLAPYVDAFNLYSGASSGQQAANLAYFQPVMTGNNMSNNTLQNAYQNMISRQTLLLQSIPYMNQVQAQNGY